MIRRDKWNSLMMMLMLRFMMHYLKAFITICHICIAIMLRKRKCSDLKSSICMMYICRLKSERARNILLKKRKNFVSHLLLFWVKNIRIFIEVHLKQIGLMYIREKEKEAVHILPVHIRVNRIFL